ncbi:MAG: hypothetical protein M3R50_12490 [Bacteroidota bacterium]|nr:hypothetical protein [Bacteroidota bacterium]
MKITHLVITGILIFFTATAFSQDTSKLHGHKKQRKDPRSLAYKRDSAIINNRNKAGVIINSNSGINGASPTSGTLGSTVNPNTEVAIPIGKRKKAKNSNPPIAPLREKSSAHDTTLKK